VDELASALARKSGWRIQPSENTALDRLGLSTQVPAQSVYLSELFALTAERRGMGSMAAFGSHHRRRAADETSKFK